MKKAVISVAIIALALIFYNTATASTVYVDAGTIEGRGIRLDSFEANVAPYKYRVTLMDLSPNFRQPDIGFNSLFLGLFDSEKEEIDSLSGPGNFTFDPVPTHEYFVSVFGAADSGAGVYGVTVNAVPIPATAWLLGGGIIGLLGLRRRFNS